MELGERHIVERFARRRDDASFRELYRRHTPMIFGMAVRLSGSRSQAEDLTQEAWIRAVERLDNFDRRSKFSTWLAGILINCHREAARRRDDRSIELHGDDPGSASVIDAFPSALQASADRVELERALVQLPDGYREAVILHDVYGYTHAEIASLLGVQEGTSKSQLARGRARLREILTNTPSPASRRDEGGGS